MGTVTVDNFTNGALNPVLAYIVSCLGGFLGLRCVTRAQSYRGTGRAAWFGLAAVSIGATGIWAMHFIAMLGFTIEGEPMTYDVPKTLESMLLAVLVVGIGLAIVGHGKTDAGWARIITGGTIIGVGVASMHYMGMEGMEMPGGVHYNPVLVALSILIAIVAGTAALWAGSHVETVRGGLGAAMILGVAVVGMHYAGMWAMSVSGPAGMTPGAGTSAFAFVVPMVIGLVLVTFGITMTLLMGRSEEEIAEDVLLQRQADAIDASWSHVSGSKVNFTGPQPRLDPGPQSGPSVRPAARHRAPGPGSPGETGPDSVPQSGPVSVPRPGPASGPTVRPSRAREQYLGNPYALLSVQGVNVVAVDNFTSGLLNPAAAYAVSCLGGFLGLRCVRRSRIDRGAARAAWLSLAAISVGATGIWAMHFIAMLGFSVPGQTITYTVPITIASMLLSILVCGIGLFIVGYGNGGRGRLLTGGVILGVGVNVMHYMGMAGMSMPDTMSYNPLLVAASVVIAVVAGTAALWLGERVNTIRDTTWAALIMGVAVTGMHYTGMSALRVHRGSTDMMTSGASGVAFLLPVIVGLVVVTFGITMALLLSRSDAEVVEDRRLDQRMAELIAKGWSEK